MDLLKGIGGVVKSLDIMGMAIEAGAQLLNLPPQVTSGVKIGAGIATGNLFTVINGFSELGNATGGNAASTQYAPSSKPGVCNTGYSTQGTSGQNGEVQRHLETLKRNLGTLDTQGFSPLTAWICKDNKINYYNLVSAANDPNCPQDVRDAARFFVGQPGLLLKLDTAAGIYPIDGVVGLADIEAMLDKVGSKSSPATSCFPTMDSLSQPLVSDSKLSGYRDALTGLTRNWEAFDSFVASADGHIHRTDFEDVLSRSTSSLEMKKVAKFFKENPEFFVRLEQSGQGSVQDLLANRKDVEAELRKVNEELTRPSGGVSSKSSAATSSEARGGVSAQDMSLEEKINHILNSTVEQPESKSKADSTKGKKASPKLQKFVKQKKSMDGLLSQMSAKA